MYELHFIVIWGWETMNFNASLQFFYGFVVARLNDTNIYVYFCAFSANTSGNTSSLSLEMTEFGGSSSINKIL